MKSSSRHRVNLLSFLLSLCVTGLTLIALPLAVDAQNKNDKGPAFKVPDGYMQMQMATFRGAMVLDPQKPVGMFVTYPNENETLESLRQRILTFVGPMFIHSEKGQANTTLSWATTPLPSHLGDGDGKAFMNLYSTSTNEVQVTIYERAGTQPFLYGYFAMRHKPGQKDDGKFLDEQGQGVKAFEKLWKSFSK